MRVGIACHNYVPHPGGLEIMVQNLATGLARKHEVTLVASAWDGKHGVSVEKGVTVHRLRSLHAAESLGVPYPLQLGPGVREALVALRRCDVLHAHGALYTTTVAAAALSRRNGAPLVLTEHVGFVSYRRELINGIQRAAWKLIGDRMVRAADSVATYNTRVEDWLRRRFPEARVQYIGNGVDVDAFRPRTPAERKALRASFGLPPEGVLVLYAGRASEKKNLDAVLAIPRDRFHLVVCGWQRNLALPGVTDLGHLPHARMPDLFGAVDLMVHASVGEGLPLAVQEAISCGVPLVLLWDSGYSGWIARDSVVACESLDQIGPELNRLAQAPDARLQLALRSRSWAEQQWSWDVTVRAYERLYEDALSRRHTRGRN